MLKRAVILITVAVILLCSSFSAYADAIPAPDWVTITTNSDSSKTLTVTTPAYMLDEIEYYEYSTDSQQSWEKLNDNTGGEFVFDKTTEFALRYVSNGFRSSIYTTTVTVSKYSVITSPAGVSLLIPFDSQLPSDISLSVHQIISGADYTAISEYFGENMSLLLLNVFIIRNNNVYNNTYTNLWYFPTGDLDARYCKIYHIDSDGNVTEIESASELNVLFFLTDKTGLFAVVEDKTYCRGDVNGDAVITAADARLALRYSAQLEVLLPVQLTAADVNSDNTVTASDARTILRISANLEK